MTTEKIPVGKIVAKLRNTVPVCLMAGGKEVKRYKNIEFPDELKGLEMVDFGFNIGPDGKITFQVFVDEGVLPEEFPANRKSVSWRERAAAKAAEAAAEVEAPVPVQEPSPAPRLYTEARFGVRESSARRLSQPSGKSAA